MQLVSSRSNLKLQSHYAESLSMLLTSALDGGGGRGGGGVGGKGRVDDG